MHAAACAGVDRSRAEQVQWLETDTNQNGHKCCKSFEISQEGVAGQMPLEADQGVLSLVEGCGSAVSV